MRERLEFWGPWLVLAVMTLAFAVGFSWLSVLRHQAFQSHAFDLGNVDQAVWNTVHGSLLRFTDMAVPPAGAVLKTRLAIHVEPILIPISLLYLLHSGPETLLVLQATVVASGAVPAYLLARIALARRWLSLVFPLAYLLHPSLQNAVLDDFHAVTLSAAFLLWALYFVYTASLRGFFASALLAAATKEEVALLVALLGLGLLWRRQMVAGLLTIVGGVLWFLVSMVFIIRHFNPAGHSPYIERYNYLGHGIGGIALGIVEHPILVWNVLTSAPRLIYLDALLDPAGFVSLLGLPALLLALPAFAVNMLSNDPSMYSGFYQYSAEIVPYVVASAVLGTAAATRAARDARFGRWVPVALATLVLAASIVSTRQYGFSPLAFGYVVPSVGPHQRLESRLIGGIPAGAVVAAADEVEPHLSNRRTIYMLPTVHPINGPPAQFVALDASIPSSPVQPWLIHHVASQLIGHGYGIEAARDGVLVLRRGETRRELPPDFFSFIFSRGSRVTPEAAHWGPLTLTGSTVHPGYGSVNRARPAVEVETCWRTARHLSSHVQIAFEVSAVYTGRHPSIAARPANRPLWSRDTDSPTMDWLPISKWPLHRSIHAAFVPYTPVPGTGGKVDVAIRVTGAGPVGGVPPSARVAGDPYAVRLATVRVGV